MPFTLAHPAAIWPLSRTRLPVAAMVAGSVAPDLPMFASLRGAYGFTHSPLGAVTADLAMSVLGVAFWFTVLRDPLVDLCPAALRDRFAASARYGTREWRLVVPAAVLGTVTHLTWDSFTHDGRWGAAHVTWLHQVHGSHTGASWAQYGSSAFGLAVVALWAVLVVRRLARTPRPATVPALGSRALAVVLAVTVTSGVAAAITTAAPGLGHWLAQAAVVGTIMMALGVLVVAGMWQVATHRRTPVA
ncbi:MAG: DUF4184 family protein [Marmoricola sp.]